MARWRVPAVDEGLAARMASTLRLRGLTARVLVGRGVLHPEAATRFLTPRLADLRLPGGIADLARAIKRISAALLAGERIGIFGDYDVDGVTSAAILTLALRGLGGTVVVRAAQRFSGYGFPPEEATRFADEGCTLVLTADCGTSDHPALAKSRDRGVDVIVIDHHQIPTGPTPAYALINPHRPDDRFSFKGLASCGVAFYLAAALRSRLREQQHAPAATFDPRSILDLVALGTLADQVPLVEDNRILVTAGLRQLSARARPGLRVLAEIAELPAGAPIDEQDVTFRLTPRLNAPGRLGQAQLALELLLAESEAEARARALEIDEVNRTRQRVQEEVWNAACAEAENQAEAPAIVVGAEGWHPGVVGIIAAKLVDRFQRPAVVIGFRDGVGRGSARTLDGFDLHAALSACGEHLEVYGGHAAAAGVTVQWTRLGAFRAAFAAQAAAHAAAICPDPETAADARAELGELDLAQVEELGRFAPFGSSNRAPLVVISGTVVRTCRQVGQGHLQLTLAQGASLADAIGFGMAAQAPGDGSVIDVVASPEVDDYRGFRRPRLRIRQMFPSGS